MEKIPILKIGDILLVTIQVDMHDRLAVSLQDDLTARIVKDHAKGVLIDISSLEMVDSFIGRMLGYIAAMSQALGAQTVVVGMRPAVAITSVVASARLGGNVNGVLLLLSRRLNDLFNASNAYFLPKGIEFHVAPPVQIDVIHLFDSAN